MARPNSTADVTSRSIEIAGVEVGLLASSPSLLKAFAVFAESVEKAGGMVEKSYGSRVSLLLPKTEEQLEETLRSDQWSWDHAQKLYNRAQNGEVLRDYERRTVEQWCENEERWVPEFIEDEEAVSN